MFRKRKRMLLLISSNYQMNTKINTIRDFMNDISVRYELKVVHDASEGCDDAKDAMVCIEYYADKLQHEVIKHLITKRKTKNGDLELEYLEFV